MLKVEEWLIKIVKATYENARRQVRINDTYSDEFEVKVGVHQGSFHSLLQFTIVLEALSGDIRVGCPWELLYADDLVLMAESMEELVEKFQRWKDSMESKGLRVNIGKTKVMICERDTSQIAESGKWLCSVCRKGVGTNSIYCNDCKS